ncbi:hypothetical protein [Neobacillus fumarioli]|uniref:hypothetical protein n=1 Tax=Neobacillus fumarioli TaxID=105229 RepID=UPI00082EF548|nr:hypothetical protein [Neobacillus fumarioli]
MNLLTSLTAAIFISCVEMVYLLGVLIAVGFLLGVIERYSNHMLVRAFGPRGVLLTAWIGTPIHELGHLMMCFIFGHRVTRVKLLQLNSPDGTLGYVEHQYNLNSFYQQVGNFFIGLGPIFSGIGSLILGMYLLVPKAYEAFTQQIQQRIALETLDVNVLRSVGEVLFELCKSLFSFENLISPSFWLFIVIAISISSHIALSRPDIRNSAKGLQIIFILLVLFNIAGKILHIDSYGLVVRIAEYNAYLLAFSGIAILFSLITLAVSFILAKVKGA